MMRALRRRHCSKGHARRPALRARPSHGVRRARRAGLRVRAADALCAPGERYDVSRFMDPGCVSPEEGRRTVPVSEREARWSTIAQDLSALAADASLDRTIGSSTRRPGDTPLDRAALDERRFEHVPSMYTRRQHRHPPVHRGALAAGHAPRPRPRVGAPYRQRGAAGSDARTRSRPPTTARTSARTLWTRRPRGGDPRARSVRPSRRSARGSTYGQGPRCVGHRAHLDGVARAAGEARPVT